MSDEKKVKHHGVAHFVLTVILFVVGAYVFGDWTQSTPLASLGVGSQLVSMLTPVETGNMAGTAAVAWSTPQLLINAFVTLVVYYVAAGIIIFLFNLVFFRKEKGK
jgi:hypothetical protein